MELITRLRDELLAEFETVRESGDYKDLQVQWDLVHPGWGLEDGPIDNTVGSFMAIAERIEERLLGRLMLAVEEVRNATDANTAWQFRHSAIMEMAAQLPLFSRFLAVDQIHDVVEDNLGGRFRPGSFEAFLEGAEEEESDAGEFARCILSDPEWPFGAEDLTTYMQYLLSNDACAHWLVGLSNAWEAHMLSQNLDVEGMPLDDILSPDLFAGASQALSIGRNLPPEQRAQWVADLLGISVEEIDEEAFEELWIREWFVDEVGALHAVAAAKANRFFVMTDFLETNMERMLEDGFALQEEGRTAFATSLLVVLAMTPIAELPFTEEGVLDYEEVIERVRGLSEGD